MRYDYPAELPVSAAHDDIIAAVRSSQVVIISGQTGSGKTTQIPKMLLEMGRGGHGRQIVHTQPRRIAARTVAERLCQEMGVHLGQEIGYQVRFTDESSPGTRLRIVTDGILLAQIQRDPQLSRYDTVIIDEAHERSLNIDFLLGYLTALLPRRPDLRLIITSATIDSVKFRDHFARALHAEVPVIEVSGRTWPVQVVYEPPDEPPALMDHVPGFEDMSDDESGEMDVPTAVARACAELALRSTHERGPRDILVFASGERDIRDFETALRRHFGPRASDLRRPDAIEIVPLFARLSAKEQHRVFEAHAHQRIVIATNVAETSLTVPGIRYVVDPGTARISRYSKTAKVQRLPIEPVSQASADQRSGRCGRVADGIAIRLYSAEDYETRPRFTEPEILRTSLGAVVLHMLSVGVARTANDVTHFGFIDPPDTRSVTDGFAELSELGAIRGDGSDATLTRIGRQLARLPIDVRLGRMVIEAANRTTPNTLAAVLVIVAFLSLQDPRERPEEKREEADRLHNRYADPTSDFLTALNLWDRVFEVDGNPGNGALRRLSRDEFLSFLRLRQWRDLVSQLRGMCRELRFTVGEVTPVSRPDPSVTGLPPERQPAHALCRSWDSEGIHRSMLAGLLSMMGMQVVREPKASDFAGLKGAARARAMKRATKTARNEYLGARGTHFAIFPASAVSRKPPSWVMGAELVETSRLWARYAATIDPSWAEPLAGSLLRTTYAEPHWSGSRGSAVAKARLLLYGLPIVADRTVQWGRINPVEARQMLIRQGLVEGDIHERFDHDDFVRGNLDILERAGDDSNRTRHPGGTVNDDDLADFYDAVLPPEATSVATLADWWRHGHDAHPHLLDFDPDAVDRLEEVETASLDDYPDRWHTRTTDGAAVDLRLGYLYDPQNPADGVTVHVPISALSRLSPEQFTWNVPGLLDELILGTIRALPKALRVQFVPAPDAARSIRGWVDEHYPDLPGSGRDGRPASPPQDGDAEGTGGSGRSGKSGGSVGSGGSGSHDSGGKRAAGSWPDFLHVFARAAIEVVGAQIHPEVLSETLVDRLPPYLRMTFSVEGNPESRTADGRRGNADGKSRRGDTARGDTQRNPRDDSHGDLHGDVSRDDSRADSHGNPQNEPQTANSARGHGAPQVLGTGKSLTELQRRFAEQARQSARHEVGRKAAAAERRGEVVEKANLLHRAGATTESRSSMLWKAALKALKLPDERVSSRWLGTEALRLASAPYPNTSALAEDLQLAAVKRLLPHAVDLPDDEALATAVEGVREIFEDTVYDVAHDAIAILERHAEVDRAVSGPADLPLLAVLQWIREHIDSLVFPGFIGQAPPDSLRRIERYLRADLLRLEKARKDRNRDVRWAWKADEAHTLVEKAMMQAKGEPAGPRHEQAMEKAVKARWMLEEFYVSLWAQELGTAEPVSLQRIHRALA
ncbi:ATP-dependent RNA helicase HrpA [uncultured Bifidobacterium sp.]|uniref:ATP-dependent RNA helicase HrpA n=1 Tax=uncultured Bifidobacterium sp. TaxID=165187 RepID=UPI0028DC9CD6|nr:ATP-dependent RNA helicase HrpA [uncultured Bifidobacterium sp.]